MTKLFAYLIILFILPPTPYLFGNDGINSCLEDYLNPPKSGIYKIVPSKSIAQELVDDTLEGEDIYGNEKLYNYLGNNLEKVKEKLSIWYYSGELGRSKNNFELVSKLVGKQYTVLLVDPGIMSRAEDFIVFAKNYVELNGQVRPIILRKAYAKHLGTTQLYRGLMLTSDEAEYISKHGILAPGMRDKTVAIGKISNIIEEENQLGSPLNELKERLYQKDENALKSTNLYMSTSRYKDIAASAAAAHSPTLNEKMKSLYVYKIEIPRISTLEVNKDTLFSSFKPSIGHGQLDAWIKAGRTMTVLNRDMGVEVIVPFHIQKDMIKQQNHYVNIPPIYEKGVAHTKILKKVAQKLKIGSKEEKLEYIQGKFDVDPDFKKQLIKWIEDKETDYEIKKHALTFFLEKGNYDEIKYLLSKLSPQEQQDFVFLWMIHPNYKRNAAHSMSALAESIATKPQLQEIGRKLLENYKCQLDFFDHPEVTAMGKLVGHKDFDGKIYEAYLPKFKQIQDFFKKTYNPEIVSIHVARAIVLDKKAPAFLRLYAARAFIEESTLGHSKVELIKTLANNNDTQLLTSIFEENSFFVSHNSADILSFLSRQPVLRRQVVNQTEVFGLVEQLTNSDWYLQPLKMELLINTIKKQKLSLYDFYTLKETIEQMRDWLAHPDKYQKLSKGHIESAKEMLEIIRSKLSKFDPEQRKKIQSEIPGL